MELFDFISWPLRDFLKKSGCRAISSRQEVLGVMKIARPVRSETI